MPHFWNNFGYLGMPDSRGAISNMAGLVLHAPVFNYFGTYFGNLGCHLGHFGTHCRTVHLPKHTHTHTTPQPAATNDTIPSDPFSIAPTSNAFPTTKFSEMIATALGIKPTAPYRPTRANLVRQSCECTQTTKIVQCRIMAL